ncbi:extracellular solute-binding protein [Swaminathania salitolerans]|uniref:ABC transporter substrate-binding protein n=1 Tax=Swaminathania salitolerans TaxID=182838 RepID=A0A511BL45_9PROT|nr:extracellular solute-binding protein [Swaminathania salitolerans]GBQ09855.1 ABC transporter substrate-binding protein [Swaminathania salitolerans LMG 21291]GEL01070.1 hypothetical protein SSA02_02330 [Swaminathania salitolerans]
MLFISREGLFLHVSPPSSMGRPVRRLLAATRLVACLLALVASPGMAQALADTHHAHHSSHRHKTRKHKRPAAPKPALAVSAGSLGAHSLLMPDQPYPLREWDGTSAALDAEAKSRKPAWLAVMVNNTLGIAACRSGLAQPLPPAPAGQNARTGVTPCAIPAGEESIVLAWDRNRLGDAAPDWGDFWDIARHPGKRALRMDPRGTLEIALMADGVSSDDIYALLATPAGIDRAFHKLDQLRPYLVWWRTPSEATRIMKSGAALMLATPHDRLATLGNKASGDKASFSAQWRQSLRQKLSWIVLRNVPPEQRSAVVAMLRDQTPVHDDTQDAPQNGQALHILAIDDGFWADRHDALLKRFQSWLTSQP